MYRDFSGDSQAIINQMGDIRAMPQSPKSPKEYRFDFPTRPVPASAAVVGGKDCKYRFTVLGTRVIRYEYAPDGVFEDRATTFAINRHFEVPKFRVIDKEDNLEIVTKNVHLQYDKRPFSPSGLTADITGKFSRHGALWRYGEKNRNLGGTARTLDEANGRIPLEGGVVSKAGYATIDDSKSMVFESDGWLTSRGPSSGNTDGYLFAFGHDYRSAVKAFYAISGNSPLLPRWALGNWWSRYYPYSGDEYLGLMTRFRDEDLPFSVGVLDMDWHLVNDPIVKGSGWTGYTWNRKLFPDPEGFMKDMHDMHLKVTLNDHPASGVRNWEDQYEDMAKAMGQDTSNGDPVVFDIANRKFNDAYFDVLLASLEKQGVDFWWMDWQQGPHSRTPGVDPLWMLNHYHYLDNKRGGKRPLAFSRYAGPGSQRYPIGFSGDTHITWESLDFQPEFTATASNIGYNWWSHDIGGHYFGHRDEELATRWLQLGVFSPIMRLHSSDNPFITKEPWTFGPEVRSIMNNFLRLRHRLLPYLYSMNVRSAKHSEPIVQPLYWHHPEVTAAYHYKNEYFFGSELLVAPITSPSDALTRLGRVRAYIPKGRHVDIFTGVVYDGNRELTLYRPLSNPPVLAREGAIIPLDGSAVPTNNCTNPTSYEILLVVGADGHFEIFEDDGLGGDLASIKFSKISISYTQATGEVKITHSDSDSVGRTWRFKIVSYLVPRDFEVKIQWVSGSSSSLKMQHDLESSSTTLSIEKFPGSAEPTFTIHLPPNPQLTVTDTKKHILPVLSKAYIDHATKLGIWQIVENHKMSVGAKVGSLSAMGLSEEMLGAVVEFLVADSRS
jgi:alpha-glucosidase (family GH31 glycosyl hydrolase)